MGWNPYYANLGSSNEAAFESVANSLIATGLQRAGYRIFWLDYGWASGARDGKGALVVSASQWPHGMSGFTAWLHGYGFLAGIYTDAGRSGCDGEGVGSYGHYQQDADTFAAWGFDAAKIDFCGAGQEGLDPRTLYPEFATALANNASGRPMVVNVDNFWTPGQIDGAHPSLANSSWDNYQWAPQIAQSWRTDTDVGFQGSIVFSNVLRNLDHDAAHPEVASPGHWNDPDYLGPALGMTDTEARSQFSMWAMLAAPLILGSDPRTLSAATLDMLENPNVIAIDQDAGDAQATLVQQIGDAQVWAKPLADGDSAVALFNRGTTPVQIGTTAGAVGLPQASGYNVDDLWTNATSTINADGNISALVPAHAARLYRVSTAGSPPADAPGTARLTVGTIGWNNGTVAADHGGISCPRSCSASYPVGTTVTLSAAPLDSATFAGWHGGGCSGTGTCTTTITTDTKVTASFVSPVRMLSVTLAGSGSVTDASGSISCPETCAAAYSDGTDVTLAANPAPRSAFIGWLGAGCSGTGTCTVTMSDARAVIALFKAIPIPIPPLIVSAAHVVRASASHRIFRVARHFRGVTATRHRPPIGTTFRYSLDKAAAVRFDFTKAVRGRYVNGKCVARNSHNKHRHACKRSVIRGTLHFAGHAGVNTVKFFGWLSRSRKLKPGKYTLVITATTPGVGSTSQKLSFTVAR